MPSTNRVDHSSLKVAVHVDVKKMFTVVSLRDRDAVIVGVGVAKRNPEDKYNEETGRALALSRALKDAAQRLERFARAQ